MDASDTHNQQGEVHAIVNPNAGHDGGGSEVQELLAAAFGERLSIHHTTCAEDVDTLTERYGPKAALLIAVGGDGTVHAVVNSLMRLDRRPCFAPLPAGTANNLCRTLGIPLDLSAAVETVARGATRRMDVPRSNDVWFTTVASGGNSGRVLECLENDVKRSWGPWCYLRAALPVATDLHAYRASVSFDGGPAERRTLWNVLVANGPFAAGGFRVAPPADLTDGMLDVILIEDGAPLDFAALTAEFFLGDYLQDERVEHRRASSLRIESEPPIQFVADGEDAGRGVVEFHVSPGALEVIVGDRA